VLVTTTCLSSVRDSHFVTIAESESPPQARARCSRAAVGEGSGRVRRRLAERRLQVDKTRLGVGLLSSRSQGTVREFYSVRRRLSPEENGDKLVGCSCHALESQRPRPTLAVMSPMVEARHPQGTEANGQERSRATTDFHLQSLRSQYGTSNESCAAPGLFVALASSTVAPRTGCSLIHQQLWSRSRYSGRAVIGKA
jgi:hypothetical protein